MLILVGVTVTVAINGGLFGKAREGAKGTEIAREKEELTLAVASAYDVETGIIKQDELEKELDEGWNVEGVEGEEGAPYNCTIGENEYIVCENGKILAVDYDKISQLLKDRNEGIIDEEESFKQIYNELQLDYYGEDTEIINNNCGFVVGSDKTTDVFYCYFYESGLMFIADTNDELIIANKEQNEYAYKLARKLRKVKVELDEFFLGKMKDEITTKYTEEELENYVLTNSDNIKSIDIEYDDSEIRIKGLAFSINNETINYCPHYTNSVYLEFDEEGYFIGTWILSE